MYEALTRASIVIELIEDVEKYEAIVVSTNGTMLQPYDTSTTLIGTVLKNNVDITNKIKNVKWTKWNPSNDNISECPEWNKRHIGMATIEIGKEDVDSKSIFTFEAYNDQDELLCSSSISIIDINDLLVSTSKPTDPYVGQLWIDDTIEPATLYVWNGYKWVVSGTVGAIAKNLLRNTNFLTNADHWDIIGDTTLSYTPTASEYLGHRFLRLCSEVISDEERGISQTTTDIINKNSEYSFQMLFYSKTDTETFSNNITVNIYSVNSKDQATIIYDNTFEAEAKIKQLYAKFKTLSDTEKIRVDIVGECGYRYNFYVAELALYNTWNEYPWTINPLDLNSLTEFTQEELWNILSNNGTVQGIFAQRNPNTGQLDYYINASMIAAGKMKARYMEMYGLKVGRKDNPDITTLEITENGDVNLNVAKLIISSTGQSIEDALDEVRSELSPEGIRNTVVKIVTEDDEVIQHITSIAEQTAEGFTQQVRDELTGSMSELSQGLDNITARVEDVESGQESLIDITSKGVYIGSGDSFVDIDGNKIAISADDIYIDASNIRLEGYTTINGGFAVDEEGNMSAKNGTFEGTVTASEIEMSTMRSSTIIAPNIFSDESENPVFSLTDDGTLTARNAVIQGELAGTILTGNTFMSANRKFVVTEGGTLECVDANIKGDITAGSTITGSKVVGGTIIGATIQNAETNPTFSVSSTGVVTGATIHGGTIGIGGTNYDAFTVDNNGNCNITRGSISIGDNFVVNNDGSFTAKSANITGNITSGSTITGATISGGSINIGNGTFTVDSEGNMVAKSATIDAEMSATTGYIAGFKISDNTLTSNNVGMSSATSLDSITFWAGSNTVSSAPFRVNNSGKVFASNVEITGGVLNIGNGNFVVTSAGNLTAKNASFHGNITAGSTITGATIQNTSGTFTVDANGNITGANITGSKITGSTISIGSGFAVDDSGNMTATAGTIGGYTIGTHTLIGGNVGMCSTSGQGWAFWAGASSGSNAPFHVGHDGTLYATSANITGTISGSNISGGSVSGTSISGGSITGTTISGGSLTIGNNFAVNSSGVLTAQSANISGSITGSDITGSTFSGKNNYFKVEDDGSVTALNITVSDISATTSTIEDLAVNTLTVRDLSSAWMDRCLTRNVKVYVTAGYSYVDEDGNPTELTTDYFEDGSTYASFSDLISVCPRNLNGWILDVYMTTDISEQINITQLCNGRLRLSMQGHSLKGYFRVFGRSMECIVYGDKVGSTKGDVRAKIIPGGIGYFYSPYRYCIHADTCKFTCYDIDFYNGTYNYTNDKGETQNGDIGIACSNGCSAYISSIKAVNNPRSLVRINAMSHVYVESSSGTTEYQTFHSVSGSILHLNDVKQAGKKGASTAAESLYTNNNGKIFADGVTYDGTTVTDNDNTNNNTETTKKVTKTVTIKSTGGNSWRTSGSYANSWASDVIVRQGRWTTSLGTNRGYWWFGNNIYNILKDSKNTINSIKIKITRNSGGANAAVTHYLRAHTIASKPSTPSNFLGTSVLNKSFSLAVGSSITLSLSAAEISALRSNNAKGFGLYTSDTTTGAGGPYSCCSSNATVTISYTYTE